ncbi:MAG: 2-amino-4-hydroxy-6-hydroxymethyldihydropteridine diphosphokinase [Acidobacteria bacterium]|nr:MAG: 2-amino-4-hydroxy-6-hydroxymethyldihydropteridine diphosphokinase [Acidobacteriota bacterium]
MSSSHDQDFSSAVFLALGSNLGNREEQLQAALGALVEEGVNVVTCSSVYRTDPLYVLDQPDFLNMVCKVQTDLSAHGLLESCLRVERRLGRSRHVDKGPREIDVDILFFGQAIIDDQTLVVPHPLLYERNFVLVPLAEIAPLFRDPRTGVTVLELKNRSQDESGVERVGRLSHC